MKEHRSQASLMAVSAYWTRQETEAVLVLSGHSFKAPYQKQICQVTLKGGRACFSIRREREGPKECRSGLGDLHNQPWIFAESCKLQPANFDIGRFVPLHKEVTSVPAPANRALARLQVGNRLRISSIYRGYQKLMRIDRDEGFSVGRNTHALRTFGRDRRRFIRFEIINPGARLMSGFIAGKKDALVVGEPLHAIEVNVFDFCEFGFPGSGRQEHQA